MKILIAIVTLTTILFIVSREVYSQTSLYNSTFERFKSQSVADSFFIMINVPDGYYTSDKKYPVLYVLDGDVAFGMAASIARYLQIGDNIPELIIVGIGYGALDKSAGEKRRRDYRPVKSGGAENFLLFLKDELIPFIDSNYRTIPEDRTITGYSIGGLFALYCLFTQPDIFNKYIVGSPGLTWDNYSIFDYEESSVDRLKEKSLNVFISVGSEESEEKFFEPIDQLVIKLQERNYPGLNLKTKVFQGSTHLVGPPESLTHGLLSVFGKD